MLIQKQKKYNTVEYIVVYPKKKKKRPCTKRELITTVTMSSSLLTILSVKSNCGHSVGNDQGRDFQLAYWMQTEQNLGPNSKQALGLG